MGLKESLVEYPPPPPALFAEGQRVRVKLAPYDDGQTPKKWYGARVSVVKARASYRENWYTLRHPCGIEDDFAEGELDRRFARKG